MSGVPLTESTFVHLLGRLSRDEFVAFVADLWAAQGWDVRQSNGVVRLRREAASADRRTMVVWPEPADLTDVAEDIDTIVTRKAGSRAAATATELEASLVDENDLYRMCLYAIERDDADALFREYFGRRVASDRPPVRGGDRPKRTDGSRAGPWRRDRRFRAIAVVAAIAIAIAVVIGAASGPLGGLAGDSGSDAPATGFTTVTTEDERQRSTTPAPVPTTDPGAGNPALGTPARQPRYLSLLPTCDRPPGLVVAIILGALHTAGRAADDGIEAAWRFSVKPIGSGDDPSQFATFLRQDRFRPLFTYQSAEYGPVVNHTETIVSQRVTLRTGGQRTAFEFVLSQSDRERTAGCWQLAGISARSDG